MTKASLRQAIARNVEGRSFVTGTITTMNGNNPRCTALSIYPDDTFNDGEFLVYAGTAIGQSRRISDFALTLGEVTPTSAFSPNAVAADSYEIHPQFGWVTDQYNEAITQAHEAASDVFLVDVADATSLSMTADIYEYAVPATFRYLCEVQEDWTDGLTNAWWNALPHDGWYVVPGSSPKLVIDSSYIVASRKLRLIGQGRATAPATDAATVQLPLAYAKTKATAALLAMQPGGDIEGTDRIKWAQYWEQRASLELQEIRRQVRPGSRSVGVL